MTPVEQYRAAWIAHKDEALSAFQNLRAFYALPMPAVPGMDTPWRLAWRIQCGRSVETAASAEYIYRWNLALRSRVFGVPHTLGM